MAQSVSKQVAILNILIAAMEVAIDSFGADDPVDTELVSDLDRLLERSRRERASLLARG